MTEPLRFRGTLQEEEDGPGVFLEVPADLRAHFGRARPPVVVTLGDHTSRSTPAVYGGRWYLAVSRSNRKAAGLEPGDEIDVTLTADDEPRTVSVPEDLRRALAQNPLAERRFEDLSYSHRREYVEWVESAKRAETRARRIARCLERIYESA